VLPEGLYYLVVLLGCTAWPGVILKLVHPEVVKKVSAFGVCVCVCVCACVRVCACVHAVIFLVQCTPVHTLFFKM
jgi:hypothetical protein